ncbi:MAG: hypothetical protein OXG59_14875 [Gammaproteobacteria bacterium]|nr:hypothetical protein [Gammaproteobacteria bacterium]
MKQKLILTGVLSLAWALATSESSAQLRVDLSVRNRALGSVTLEDAPKGTYGTRGSIESRGIGAAGCSETGELPVDQGTIYVDADCGTLTWEFHIKPYPAEGVMASGQLSWYSEAPTWWIISEGDVILRGADTGRVPGVSFLADDQPLEVRAGPRSLPALDQAPGFWLLGQPALVDRGSVRHFFDRETIPQHLAGVLDSHSAGIGYLLETLPHAELPPVFWMGLAQWQMSVGGAAGTGLVLANYPLRAQDFDRTAHAITLYVVLHEHGHHLFDAPGPLWIGESLASYLAIKAMKETAPELYPVVDDAFIAPGLALEAPLPVLGEQADAGDGQAYVQVYMGAAFWMALDDAVRTQGVQGGFLRVLPELVARGFAPNGTPRPDVIAQVTRLTPESLYPILDRYLGPQ